MTDETTQKCARAELSAAELRVLGSLIEKQLATPETYPLTLNSAVLACNQKTSREPVMDLTPGQVGQALRSLEERGMARLVMGSRADRWEQRLDKALELVSPQVVLLCLLMLRGPQTVSELLTRSSRLYAFDDAEQVSHHLERMISRQLVVQLPRQAGQREERYMHELGNPADMQALLAARAAEPARSTGQELRLEALEERIAILEERLALLESSINA
jgi:uncharacterized protein YceH (UPF0502 family)